MLDEKFELSNGVQIPAIGFGTGIATGISEQPLRIVKRWVKETAKNILVKDFKKNNIYTLKSDLKKDKSLMLVAHDAAVNGVRLFDTARAYNQSERKLGGALREELNTHREEYFIITKLTNTAQRRGTQMQDFETSLAELGLDHVDLYLMHWPQTDTYLQSWKVMEQIYHSGRARAIGMCNCHVHHLEELRKNCEIMPMANELECHPLLQQQEVREYCKEHKIQLIAHTPTGKMRPQVTDSPVIKELMEKYSVGASQIILRWHYQLGDVSIPNTTNVKHLLQNIDIGDFTLTEEEMQEIRKLDCGYRIWPNPDTCDFTKL